MAKMGSIEIEVRPTISFESAKGCVTLLNMFLESNDEYVLDRAIKDSSGKLEWRLNKKRDKPMCSFEEMIYGREE